MADGSVFRIRAWYGQWTDRSEGEYPRRLSIAMARRPATGGKRAGHLTIDAFVEPFHVWHCDEAPAGRPPRAGARSRSKGRRG
jgi:hypothetical protein